MSREVIAAVCHRLRYKMYVWHHIPLKYFLPGRDKEFYLLADELRTFGHIRLHQRLHFGSSEPIAFLSGRLQAIHRAFAVERNLDNATEAELAWLANYRQTSVQPRG